MTPRTVPIVCAKAPRHIVYVPAVANYIYELDELLAKRYWTCSFCGARVRVVA